MRDCVECGQGLQPMRCTSLRCTVDAYFLGCETCSLTQSSEKMTWFRCGHACHKYCIDSTAHKPEKCPTCAAVDGVEYAEDPAAECTNICVNWTKKQKCRFGDDCRYCHLHPKYAGPCRKSKKQRDCAAKYAVKETRTTVVSLTADNVPPAETLWEVVVRGGNMVLLSIGSPGVKVSTYSSIEELTESYACFAGPIAGFFQENLGTFVEALSFFAGSQLVVASEAWSTKGDRREGCVVAYQGVVFHVLDMSELNTLLIAFYGPIHTMLHRCLPGLADMGTYLDFRQIYRNQHDFTERIGTIRKRCGRYEGALIDLQSAWKLPGESLLDLDERDRAIEQCYQRFDEEMKAAYDVYFHLLRCENRHGAFLMTFVNLMARRWEFFRGHQLEQMLEQLGKTAVFGWCSQQLDASREALTQAMRCIEATQTSDVLVFEMHYRMAMQGTLEERWYAEDARLFRFLGWKGGTRKPDPHAILRNRAYAARAISAMQQVYRGDSPRIACDDRVSSVKIVAAVNGVRSGEVSVADFFRAVNQEVKAMSKNTDVNQRALQCVSTLLSMMNWLPLRSCAKKAGLDSESDLELNAIRNFNNDDGDLAIV